ncbi:MAG: SIMPL domain-containing protein [bacterium]|nr:SIMPL domain-containing protein [bacterium]
MCNLKEETKNIFAVVLGLFLIVLTVSTAIDIKNKLEETENTITVTDTGTIYAKPDLAVANFSVVVEAKTVGEAMSENTQKMNAVISFMKEQGIEDKDLKTTNFNIYPRYEWYDSTQYYPSGKRVLVGYEVTQTLQVKIRNIEKIGEILEGGTSAGANEVSDLEFTIDNQDELKKQARKEAITKAKAKAEELAKELGINLVRISNFSESSVLPYFYSMKEAAVGMGGDEALAPSIQTGENKIEVTVSITYEIK